MVGAASFATAVRVTPARSGAGPYERDMSVALENATAARLFIGRINVECSNDTRNFDSVNPPEFSLKLRTRPPSRPLISF
jgi:hypothetical protein